MKKEVINEMFKGNQIALTLLEDAKRKDGSFSDFKLRIAASKSYKEYAENLFFGFNSVQNFCRKVNEKTFEELTDANGKTFAEFSNGRTFTQVLQEDANKIEFMLYLSKITAKIKLQTLSLANDEILFDHLNTYGTKRELNTKDGKKTKVSLNLFLACLERYVKERNKKTVPEQIEDAKEEKTTDVSIVNIEEKTTDVSTELKEAI